MRPKINFITLAVEDIAVSIAFYQSAFSLSIAEQSDELCLFEMEDDFYVVIQAKDDFLNQVGQSTKNISRAGVILSHNATSETEVEQIVAQALKAGAERVKTLTEDWGHSVTLRDINGYHWEIVYTDS